MSFRPYCNVAILLFSVLINASCLHLSIAQTSEAANNRDRQQASGQQQSEPNAPNPAIQTVEPHRANSDANRNRSKQEDIKPQNLPQPTGIPVERLIRFLHRTDRFFSNHAQAFQAIGNLSQAFFALILLLVAARQAAIAKRQTEISNESREIALAALGRPHLFGEMISHNLEDWRNGTGYPYVRFRLVNHGTGPAIIADAKTHAFLSRGKQFWKESDEAESNYIKKFPEPNELDFFRTYSGAHALIAHHELNGSVAYERGPEIQWKDFVVPAGKDTGLLSSQIVCGSPIDQHNLRSGKESVYSFMYSATGPEGGVQPWLLVMVFYLDTLGNTYVTNFCGFGDKNGCMSTYGEAPYNHRT